MLFQIFDWPDIRRLYWVTFQRMRGLFVCCPVFAILFLSHLATRSRQRQNPWPGAGAWLAIAVVAWFLLFQLSYIGWAGGSAVGPRYLTPALPFVFLAARRGFERFRRSAAILIVVSIVQMLVVTAVQPLYPANDQGPPRHSGPVGPAIVNLFHGIVARTPGATNLGLLAGVRGAWSLLPPALLIVSFFGLAFRWKPNCNALEQ